MKTCCCGCSLKTGCLIIGYLHTILTLVGFGYLFFGGIVLISEGSTHSEGAAKVYFMVSFIILKFVTINVLFLYGVYKGKAAYILPWLVWFFMLIMIQGFSVTYLAIYLNISAWIGAVFWMLVQFALQVYCILVVSTFYHNLKKKSSLIDEENMPM